MPQKILHNKRIVLTVMLTAVICLFFWLGSRYPALNEKALMGGNTAISGIGFDVLMEVDDDASVVMQIIANTVNWTYTNKQGMTFGILMAAALMTLMPLFGERRYKSRLANTLAGVFVGSPLGVCVNCATPIAQGIQAAGGRTEMMLATMFSSPTLNFIVLSMVFALFPLHLAVVKVALTLVFIIIGVPLVSRFAELSSQGSSGIAMATSQPNRFSGSFASFDSDAFFFQVSETWMKAGRWVIGRFGRNLWYIIKIAVPLMLLAGFLGSVLITLLPFDSLVAVIPQNGRVVTLIVMGVFALIGVFVPVPMAFDVIVTAVLIEAGLPIKYAMVLLFTLGIFSVYPFFVLWRSVSKQLAALTFAGVATLGLVSGVAGHTIDKAVLERESEALLATFASTIGEVSIGTAKDNSIHTSQETLLPTLLANATIATELIVQSDSTISASGSPFSTSPQVATSTLFSPVWAEQLGIIDRNDVTVHHMLEPFSYSRPIASGDVHGDGWIDLLLVDTTGIALHVNQQGNGWTRQAIDIPEFNDPQVVSLALVDLNNDGWLDIFFSTFNSGNRIAYNESGYFLPENLHLLPGLEGTVATIAPAFGDVDLDGDLDIFLGNWTGGTLVKPWSVNTSQNAVLINESDSFTLHPLDGVAGETLSSLFTYLNDDPWLDLIVGNDFGIPDRFFLGDGRGGFTPVVQADGLIPVTTQSTMSYSSADIDNDLSTDLFAAQISFSAESQPLPSDTTPCPENIGTAGYESCVYQWETARILDNGNTVSDCSKVINQLFIDCVMIQLVRTVSRTNQANLCDLIPEGWRYMRFHCATAGKGPKGEFLPIAEAVDRDSEITQQLEENIMLTQRSDGTWQRYSNETTQIGGWSWNAKFADLDQDGWQDLYVANGIIGFKGRRLQVDTNYFYHNQQDGSFVDATDDFGLASLLHTGSYTYIDIDNDGDLDIVTVPTVTQMLVMVNNGPAGNSITFQLRDEQGNHFGIGSAVIAYYGDGQRQMRELFASGGFRSFDAPIAHFGLDEHQQVTQLEVRWSTGATTLIDGPFEAGASYTITRHGE